MTPALDDFGTERARCPDCGRAHEYVRPGKTQPTCDCHERCPVHGPNMIVYHPPGEFEHTSGYFCAACMRAQRARLCLRNPVNSPLYLKPRRADGRIKSGREYFSYLKEAP